LRQRRPTEMNSQRSYSLYFIWEALDDARA